MGLYLIRARDTSMDMRRGATRALDARTKWWCYIISRFNYIYIYILYNTPLLDVYDTGEIPKSARVSAEEINTPAKKKQRYKYICILFCMSK